MFDADVFKTSLGGTTRFNISDEPSRSSVKNKRMRATMMRQMLFRRASFTGILDFLLTDKDMRSPVS